MSNVPDSWSDLRSLTAARIALGRSGGSLPTQELLDFGLAHARARDSVMMSFEPDVLAKDFQKRGLNAMVLHSEATSRDEYLRRPDRGRRLNAQSLAQLATAPCEAGEDLSLIVSDGLSARAAEHSIEVVTGLQSRLTSDGWRVSPVMVIPFARVAIQDQIGECRGSALSLILLGERPGLGATDSLGAYFIHAPRVGKTDADRNCVSNIRPDGLPISTAVTTLHHLLTMARHRKLSGVNLKDERLLRGSFESAGSRLDQVPGTT